MCAAPRGATCEYPAAPRGARQRKPAAGPLVHLVDVGAGGDEPLHDVRVALLRREVQERLAREAGLESKDTNE